MRPTNLGKRIYSSGKDVKLDKNIKNLLAFKPLLARIFRESITECSDMSYEEIEKCIEGRLDISCIGVEPGDSRIDGCNQEDAEIGEGKVTYDIRTYLRIPKKECIGVKILVDLEAQKDDSPGYDISERALFYCCRMISSQLTTEFTTASDDSVKYGNIKKVYSIWICTEASKKRANSISRFCIKKETRPEEKEYNGRYDLLEAVIINISKDHDDENSKIELIRMLTELFNEEKTGEEKIERLKNEFNLPTTKQYEQEVLNMTAYSARLISESTEKGIEKGRLLERLKFLKLLIAKGFSKEDILNLDYTESEYEEAKKDN